MEEGKEGHSCCGGHEDHAAKKEACGSEGDSCGCGHEHGEFDASFLQLVSGLHGSAWILLGKVANPATGKIDKDLLSAKAMIDTLVMLKEKTKGNLNDMEENTLNEMVSGLQLNYVEETKSCADKETEKEEETKTDEKAPVEKVETQEPSSKPQPVEENPHCGSGSCSPKDKETKEASSESKEEAELKVETVSPEAQEQSSDPKGAK